MSPQPSLLSELKRRNVLRAAAFYAASAWVLVQVVTQVLPLFDVPAWSMRWVVIACVVGFPFWTVFAWFYEWTADGLQRESVIAPDATAARTRGHTFDRAIIAVLAIAVVLLLSNLVVTRNNAPSHDRDQSAPSGLAKSIAVLPLVNESGDKDQQYFSDGLSENLIVTLSQVSGLKVIGRNSSFQFRDTKDDSKTIGAKLGVATLLEGSVQRAGEAVRISAELIRTIDGSTLWTQRYDRPYKDLFALQDEIAQSVTGALKTKLLTSDIAVVQTDRPPSGNLDAYTAYLQGNFHAARGSEADWREAIRQYAVATRLDPHYAMAWAASSHASNWLAGAFLGGTEAQQVDAEAKQAADMALKLEPGLAAAHSARGELLSSFNFDWSGAEAEFRRALQLAPKNEVAMENLGVLFAARGQTEQAIQLTQQSLATDPLRATGYLLLSRYLSSLGRLDEAEQTIRRGIALQPASGNFDAELAVIEIQRGDANASLAIAQRTLPGIWQDYAVAMSQQIGNDRAAADAAVKLLIDKHADGMAFQIAEMYALRRDPDHAFEWLDRAWLGHDPGLQFLLVNPFLLRFRDDARFAAFCNKIGVPATTTAKALP